MGKYSEIAEGINSNIQSGIDKFSDIVGKEKSSFDIVNTINQVRSSTLSKDALSTFVLESQSIVTAMIISEEAHLMSVKTAVSNEGKQKDIEEAQRLAKLKEAEEEETKKG